MSEQGGLQLQLSMDIEDTRQDFRRPTSTFSLPQQAGLTASLGPAKLDWANALESRVEASASAVLGELEYLMLDYGARRLVATFHVKNPPSYSDGACSAENREYIMNLLAGKEEALDDGDEMRDGLVPVASGAGMLGPPGQEVQTFLIADIRGYTRFTNDHGDEAAARLARVFASLSRAAAKEHGGTVTELRGDEALAVFQSPRSALRAAVDLQSRCRAHTESNPHLPLPIGIGLDVGEGVPVEGGVRTGALNLASRLTSLAAPGEVLVTDGLVHLARKVEGLSYGDRGEVQIRGLDGPVHVFGVGVEGDVPTLRRLSAARSHDETLQAAMVTGLVGGAFALAGALGDQLFTTGTTIPVIIGLGFGAMALLGASRTEQNPDRASLAMIAATIGLVLAVGWWAVIAAIVLLVASGMAIARRDRGASR